MVYALCHKVHTERNTDLYKRLMLSKFHNKIIKESVEVS